MRNLRRYFPAGLCLLTMAALILDSKTAAEAAADGVQMCVRTVVPSLFPFFVLSAYLVPYAAKLRFPVLGQLLKIPPGWESLFLLGCIGGYPVGAQCVAQSYAAGKLEEKQAQRMVGFCTNCGPSFLFGIVGRCFSDPWDGAAVMFIGIGSAALIGAFWPHPPQEKQSSLPELVPIPLSQAIQQAIRSISCVCAWVIIGKILLEFVNKAGLSQCPAEFQVILSGGIELTNGCMLLKICPEESARFVLACMITSFGGFCVAMQVYSLCAQCKLDCRWYLPQKAVQSVIAAAFAAIYVLLPGHPLVRILILSLMVLLILILGKKTVEIPKPMVYNGATKGGI